MSCVFTGQYRDDPRGPYSTDQSQPKNAGPDGWRFLHLSALDGKLTQKLARDFAACISCIDCKRHFVEMIERLPIAGNNAFARTVEWHGEVNRRRGVPTISVEQARKLWGGPRTKVASSERVVPKASDAIVAAI